MSSGPGADGGGAQDLTSATVCSDGRRDGDETDVDCGGSCSPCGAGAACLHAVDCASRLCANNLCAAAPDIAVSDLAPPDIAVADLASPDLAAPDLAAHDLAARDGSTHVADLALATPDLPASVAVRPLLFGGYGPTENGDTWDWDGTSWRLRTLTGPPPRTNAAMTWDSRRARAILFGGSNPTAGTLGDTWEWDDTSWSQKVTASGPPGGMWPALAFDSARGKTILYGGDNPPKTDTWEWDGTKWTQVFVSGPSQRGGASMAFDANRGKMVLFGGTDGSNNFGDTWEWDGATWTGVPR